MKEKYHIVCPRIWEYSVEVEDGIITWCSNRPGGKDHWCMMNGAKFEDLKRYYDSAIDPKYPVYIEKMEL